MLQRVIDLGRMLVFQRRNLYGLAVFFSPQAVEAPGILMSLTQVLAEKGISIFHIVGSGRQPDGSYYMLLYVDFADKDPYEVTKELYKVKYVEEIEVLEPVVPGIVVDTVTDRLMLADERAVILRHTIYRGLFGVIREELGASASAIFYHIGLRAGRDAFKSHVRILKGRKDVASLVRLCEALWRTVGFGRLEVVLVDTQGGRAVARVYDNFECEMFKSSGKPQGYLTRGLLEGWFEGILDSELKGEETKCIAKGDPYCEFVFTRA